MSHVAWPQLPNLALRLYAAKAATAGSEPLSGFIRDPEALALLTSLDEIVSARRPIGGAARVASPHEPQGFDPMGAFFGQVLTDLDARHSDARGGVTKAGLLLKALSAGIGTSPCDPCSAAGSCCACQWTGPSFVAEENALAARAVCLRPARELFDYAARVAAEAYEPMIVAGRPFVALDFSTAFMTKACAELKTAVQAETSEATPHGQPPRSRVVEAQFVVDSKEKRFSPTDYLALPYVFAHECIAHAFSGVALNDPMGWASQNFHEGWMDEVAALLLEDAIMSKVRTFESRNWLYGREEFVVAMQRVRGNRTDPDQSNPPADLSLWTEGIDAFKGLQKVVQVALDSDAVQVSPLAVSIAVDFSLALNVSSMSHEDRGNFVSTVAQDFARATLGDVRTEVAQKPYLKTAMLEYAQARDQTVFNPEPVVRSTLATR